MRGVIGLESVWKIGGWSKRHYLTHPWKWFGAMWRRLKWAWQRSTRGFADPDWWNMNDWISEVMPVMLETMAEKSCGYPGEEKGFTEASWKKYLLEIAAHLRNCTEDTAEAVNVYSDEWHEMIDKLEITHSTDEHGNMVASCAPLADEQQKLYENYLARCKELYEWQRQEAYKGFSMLAKVYFDLWD